MMAAESPLGALRLRLTDGDQRERQAEVALAAAVDAVDLAAQQLDRARLGAGALVNSIALAPEARSEMSENERLLAEASAVVGEMRQILLLVSKQLGMNFARPTSMMATSGPTSMEAAERGALAAWERQLVRERAVAVMAGGD